MTRRFSIIVFLTLLLLSSLPAERASSQEADLVLLNGNILTVDKDFTRVSALAVQSGKILAVGSDQQIRQFIGPKTRLIDLKGKTVLPGLIETHCHSIGVGINALRSKYVELSSIADIQQWLQTNAAKHPAGTWLRVPRTDITRLKERRHPTPAELDKACSTHPVHFNAARKNVLNTLGFKRLGVTPETKTVGGGQLIRDTEGNPRMLAGGDAEIRKHFPSPVYSEKQRREALKGVHRRYNEVGITSIFERANNKEGYRLYEQMHAEGQLTVRSTHTIRQQFRSGDQVRSFTRSLGLVTGQGNDWVRVGPLKITVDGGIHWGTTNLREPYGERRIRFYALNGLQKPEWHGSARYSVDLMRDIFQAGHELRWQMCCHVTGDAGVDKVLDALEAANRQVPLTDRRFTLTHAYFPAVDAIERAHKLGVCVDTQTYLYYRDSEAIAEVYGGRWADRFIGLGDWLRGGIPTTINSDHMIGMDPDHAMNSFNPFLLMHIAISRRNDRGHIHGKHQKISRQDALRCYTSTAAYLAFDESRKGRLQPGKLADLIIIDRDYLACPPDEIRDIRVLKTMVDGKFVYQRK